jgi:hypothetical protein
MDFAAKYAEVVFTVQQDVDEARAFYADLKRRVAAAGRDPDHCKVLPGIFPVVGRTRAAADDKLQMLLSLIDEKIALGTISTRFGHDVSKYPLDGPLPDFPSTEGGRSFWPVMQARAKRENLTWRQIYNEMALGRGYIVPCGAPEDLADFMEDWFVTRACDGFIVTPPDFPSGFNDFVDLVIPTLQRGGPQRGAAELGLVGRLAIGAQIEQDRHRDREPEQLAALRLRQWLQVEHEPAADEQRDPGRDRAQGAVQAAPAAGILVRIPLGVRLRARLRGWARHGALSRSRHSPRSTAW